MGGPPAAPPHAAGVSDTSGKCLRPRKNVTFSSRRTPGKSLRRPWAATRCRPRAKRAPERSAEFLDPPVWRDVGNATLCCKICNSLTAPVGEPANELARIPPWARSKIQAAGNGGAKTIRARAEIHHSTWCKFRRAGNSGVGFIGKSFSKKCATRLAKPTCETGCPAPRRTGNSSWPGSSGKLMQGSPRNQEPNPPMFPTLRMTMSLVLVASLAIVAGAAVTQDGYSVVVAVLRLPSAWGSVL